MARTLQTLLTVLIANFCAIQIGWAQQGCDNNPGNLFNATLCTFPCDGTVFNGQTFGYSKGPNLGWCGSIENDQWIAFIANATTVEWLAEVDAGCPPQSGGIQFGVYNFDNMLIGSCIGSGAGPGFVGPLVATGLICGEAYVLRIDGFAGAFCEFKLTPVRGINTSVPTKPGPITGPRRVCPDGTPKRFQFPTSGTCAQNFYLWTVDPGLYPEGNMIIDPPTATSLGTDDPWIDISFLDIPTGLLPGQCVNINISAKAIGLCGDSPESDIFPVQYCEPLPQIFERDVCQGGSIVFRGNTYTDIDALFGSIALPPVIDPNLGIGPPFCPRVDSLKLTILPASFESESLVLCGTSPFTSCPNPDPAGNPADGSVVSCISTGPNGCQLTTFYTIIRNNPVANITAPTTNFGCTGPTSILLNAAPGSSTSGGTKVVTYRWQNGGGALLGTSATYNATGPGTYTLTVTMTDTNQAQPRTACTATATITLTQTVTTPQPPTVASPSPICAGALPITFAATGGPSANSYIWRVATSGVTGAPSAAGDTYQVTATGGATSVEVCARIAGAGTVCPGSGETCRTVSINPAPTPVTLAGPATLCAGAAGTITINGYTATNGYTLSTTGAGASATQSGATINVTMGTAATRVCVTPTTPTCGNAPQVCFDITPGALPVATAPSGPGSACVNTSATYTIPALPTGTTASWTVTGGTSSPSSNSLSNNVTWNAAGTGIVCVRLTNACGQSAPACTNVTVRDAGVATLAGGGSFCAGSTPPAVTITFTGTGPYNYEYTIGGGAPISGTSTSPSVTLPNTGRGAYALTSFTAGTAPNTCPGTTAGTATVTELPSPSASIGGTATICPGGTGSVNVTFTGGTGPWTFTPAINGTPQSPVTASTSPYTLPVSQAGTYTITSVSTGTAPNICTGTGSGTAVVALTPALVVGQFNYTCQPNGLNYTGTINISGGQAPYTITWPGGSPATQASAGVFTSPAIPTGTSLVFTITDASGCPANTLTRTATNSCACPSEVGTLTISPELTICGTSSPIDASTRYNPAGELTPAPYVKRYILHTGTDPSTGQLQTNTSGSFTFASPMVQGTVYYVTVVVGILDGSGNFDFTSNCTRVSATLPIRWLNEPTATLSGGADICSGDPASMQIIFTGTAPYSFTYNTGGAPITGTAPSSPFTLNLPALSATTTVTLTGVTSGGCTGVASGSALFTVRPPVMASGAPVCNGTATGYTVTVALSGGDAGSYTVTPAGQGTITGNTFVSNLITPGAGYSFTFTDQYGCSPVTISRPSFNCPCLSDAGTMTTPLVEVCGNGSITVPATTGQVADANDILGYVLKTSNGTTITGLLAGPQATPVFTFIPGTTAYGTTYYVSAVMGNDVGGVTDLTDPCLDVSEPTSIRWNEAPTASITAGSPICVNTNGTATVTLTGSSPWSLSYTVNGGAPQNVTVAASPYTITLPSLTATTTVALTGVSSGSGASLCPGTASGSQTIVVNQAVTATATETCDGTGTMYTVTVTISGGDAASYVVTPAGSGTIAGNIFTSNLLAAGTGYSYTITDQYGCTPATVSKANHSCNCLSEAGTVSQTAISICGTGDANGTPSVGAFADADDIQGYILHTGSSASVGTLLAGPQASPVFAFIPGTTQFGVTYYISSVMGNNVGGITDLSDNCLDVAIGTPVRWNEAPTASLTVGSPICVNTSGTVTVTLTGSAPWNLSYTVNGGAPQNVIVAASPHVITLPSLSANTTVALTGVSSGSGATLCPGTASGSEVITVNQAVTAAASETCDGTGTMYTVTVTISGGDAASYVVTPAGAGTIAGNIFTSNLINVGTGYSFTITDQYGCTPATVSKATHSCNCLSDAGTVSQTALSICGTGDANGTPSVGAIPDADDIQGYILHTGSSASVGTLLAGPQASPIFAFIPGTTLYGTTYYISSVMGNDVGGITDLSDDCLDVSIGTPVRWNEAPTVALSGTYDVCPGEPTPLIFTATGSGNIDVVYTDGTNNYNVTIQAGTTNEPAPIAGAATFTIVSAMSGSCAGTISGTATVTLLSGPSVAANPTVEYSGDFTQYRITFQITGGDPATYTVDGNSLSGATSFTSQWINCGTPYSFLVDDGGGCSPVPVNGNPNCSCQTAVGTLSGNFQSCDQTEAATFVYNATNENLDANDGVQYILYTSDRLNPLFRSATPTFSFAAPMVLGTVYNIAAVAGDAVGGVVDLNESCTVFSAPATAVWNESPSASFTAPTALCAGESWDVIFTVTGSASAKTLTYTLNGVSATVANVLPGTPRTVSLNPPAGATLVLTQVSDANCTTTLSQTITVDVAQAIVVSNEDNDRCNSTNTEYTVTFEITGGDAATYAVLPAGSGTLSGSNPAVFTSNPLASGAAYDFTVSDGSGCFTVQVSGSKNCNCATIAGQMTSSALQRICEGEDLAASYILNSATLDGNDAVRFALRRSNDRVSYLDDIIAMSTTPSFPYDPATMMAGETYYITTLAGDSTLTGLIATDPCLSIGNSTPIYITPPPSGMLTGETVICEGGSATITIVLVGEGPFDVTISEGENGPTTTFPGINNGYTFQVDPVTGTVYVLRNVTMSSQPQCSASLNSLVSVSVDELLTAGTADAALQLCENSGDIVALADRITGADPNGRWTQSAGAGAAADFDAATGTVRNRNLAPGSYTFNYTVGGGASVCPTDFAEVALVVAPSPEADAGEDQLLTCDVQEVTIGTANGLPGFTYSWQGAGVTSPNSPSTTTKEPGTYTLLVTSPGLACEGRDEVVVEASEEVPVLENVRTLGETCFGDNDGQLIATVTGGQAPLFFELNNAPATRTPRFENLRPGPQKLRITDAAGCVLEETIMVEGAKEVVVDAGANVEIEYGTGHGVRLYLEGSVETIRWTGDSLLCSSNRILCDTVTLYPRFSGTYQVEVRDSNGCVARDYLQLLVRRERPVDVPTAFSPNGDGVNDLITVVAREGVLDQVNTFMIFDRWGELMYEASNFPPNNLNFGWNGEHRDQEMNSQVFVYWAEVKYLDGTTETIKGDFTLMR